VTARALCLVALLALAPSAAAAKSRGPRPAAAPAATVAERSAKADAPARAEKTEDEGASAKSPTKTADGKTIKTKTYTFGAMDVEGKLKTPQLLYFLNRVKLELDMSAPDKRSFMKELAKSSEDKSL
jgi:hypothetical protein